MGKQAGPEGARLLPSAAPPCSAPCPLSHPMRRLLPPDPGQPPGGGQMVPGERVGLGTGRSASFSRLHREVLCGTTYFFAHVPSSSFPLARRFFQTFPLAVRELFLTSASRSSGSLPSRCHQHRASPPLPCCTQRVFCQAKPSALGAAFPAFNLCVLGFWFCCSHLLLQGGAFPFLPQVGGAVQRTEPCPRGPAGLAAPHAHTAVKPPWSSPCPEGLAAHKARELCGRTPHGVTSGPRSPGTAISAR